jgi:hypothetical protein
MYVLVQSTEIFKSCHQFMILGGFYVYLNMDKPYNQF